MSINVYPVPEIDVQYSDSASLDAFARLRVSNPTTLFDSKQIFDNLPLFWDDSEVSGGSTTSSYSTDTASSVMGVATTTAGKRVRQTFMRFNYQPGKSQLILLTGTLDKSGGGTGITRGMGIYDDDNGIFWQDNEGVLEIVCRTSTSGSAVDNEVTQSSWNVDPLDGSGKSGKTIDASKSNILIIDFEWLGVGRVRVGFVIDGSVFYAHEFLNANNLSEVYMSTPNLPLRYEIDNDGSGAASTLEQVCGTVISEGGTSQLGSLRYRSTEGTSVSTPALSTIYAVIGIRLQAAKVGCTVNLAALSMLESGGNDDYEWLVILNPTIAGGGLTYANETNSCVQTAIGATANTVTGGTITAGGLVKSGRAIQGSNTASLENAIRLGVALDGTLDQFVLCVRPLLAGASMQASLGWRELS